MPVMAFVAERKDESPVRASVAMMRGTTMRMIFSLIVTHLSLAPGECSYKGKLDFQTFAWKLSKSGLPSQQRKQQREKSWLKTARSAS